jgi:predicted metal-dependent phosphotriesterase family hydrolase
VSVTLQNEERKTLYSVAFENWRTGYTGFVHLHAKNYADAVNQVLTSKSFGPKVRIVGIAPAVGVFVTESSDGKKQEVSV